MAEYGSSKEQSRYAPISQTDVEVFSQRYELGSTIVTSNLPFEDCAQKSAPERLTGALLNLLT